MAKDHHIQFKINAERMSLSRQTKSAIKSVLWKMQRYRPAPQGGHVSLFGSRRGGSTWLMEVISANPEFRFIKQPFAAYAGAGETGAHVYRIAYDHFLSPSDDELSCIAEFIEGLLSGQIVVRAPWKFWRPDFWARKSRTVLKILQAKPLMPWFSRFDSQVVYLIRHPLAQATSVAKAKWPPIHRLYLDHATFMSDHFDAKQREFCRRVANEGSLLEHHVLAWCLDNLVPIRALQSGPQDWIIIHYEDCIVDPHSVVGRLAEQLGIDDLDPMTRQISQASGTTKITNARGANVFDEAQLTKWRAQHSAKDIEGAFAILQELDMAIYDPDSPLPTIRFGNAVV